MTILKGTVPSLGTRLRQRLGDAWALNDEAADRIEQLEDRLKIQDELLTDKCDELKAATLRLARLQKWIRDISEHTPHAWLKEESKELLDE